MYDVGNEPIDWAYSQSTGRLYLADGEDVRALVASGYSGAVGYQNRPEFEGLVAKGPIPRGVWRIGIGFTHRRLGRVAIPLEPADPKTALGRGGFYIHGDNQRGDGSASSGCIVLPYEARCIIAAARTAGVRTLVVVD